MTFIDEQEFKKMAATYRRAYNQISRVVTWLDDNGQRTVGYGVGYGLQHLPEPDRFDETFGDAERRGQACRDALDALHVEHGGCMRAARMTKPQLTTAQSLTFRIVRDDRVDPDRHFLVYSGPLHSAYWKSLTEDEQFQYQTNPTEKHELRKAAWHSLCEADSLIVAPVHRVGRFDYWKSALVIFADFPNTVAIP